MLKILLQSIKCKKKKNTLGCLFYYPDRNHIGYEIWISSLNH